MDLATLAIPAGIALVASVAEEVRVSRVARWVLVLIIDLSGAFACGAFSWQFGLPLVHTLAGSGDRLALAVGVATIVGAAITVPCAAWAAGPRTEIARPRVEDADPHHSPRERFNLAAEQIGNRNSPATQLAGVASMASLANDWPMGRQNCIDVLCGYLRMPYEPVSAPPGERQVRLFIIETIRSNLADQSASDWKGCTFDFSSAVFDQGSLDGSRFVEGSVSFSGSKFFDVGLSVRGVLFWNCSLDCSRIVIDGESALNFDGSVFSGTRTKFSEITLPSGLLSLQRTTWYAGSHDFDGLSLRGGRVFFDEAKFKPSQRLADEDRYALLLFRNCKLEAGNLSFRNVQFEYEFDAKLRGRRKPPLDNGRRPWPSTLIFDNDSKLAGATVDFSGAQFTQGDIQIAVDATAGSILFRGTKFGDGTVSFVSSKLDGCLLDFSYATLLPNEESLESSYGSPFSQKWMAPIKDAINCGADVWFARMRYPIPSIDFTGTALGEVQIEFECIEAYGGIIDFKGAFFDGVDICFAGARFHGSIIVLWNTGWRTRRGQIRFDMFSSPTILTDEHHLHHNKLTIVRTDPYEAGHDGAAEAISQLREITPWAIGISGID